MTPDAADPARGDLGQAQLHCPICSAVLPEPAIRAPDRLQGTPGEHQVARCRNCGAGVTLPLVGDEQLAAFYPDRYGPYDERMSAVQRVVSRAIRALQGWTALRTAPLSALQTRPPGRGLDVGCGRGDLLAALASRGWADVRHRAVVVGLRRGGATRPRRALRHPEHRRARARVL